MKFIRDENGQTLVIVVLSLTLMIGMVAFATEVGLMLRQRRMAQSAADAAALAAATESLNEGTPSSVTGGMWNVASQDSSMNGFTPGSSSGTQNSTTGVTLALNVSPNITVPNFNHPGYIQAIAIVNMPTDFIIAGITSMNVGATAIASNFISSNGCVYVQNPGDVADPAVDMGGNSLISSPNCGMTVNGNLTMGGNAKINAAFVDATGTISGKNAGSNWGEGVPPQTDPLWSLQQTANQPTVPTGTAPGGACVAPAGSGMSCIYDANNGVLSGTLTSNTIYYFDSAVNGGRGPSVTGAVTGSGVTLYFANNIPFDFNNNGTVSLTPPGFGSTCVGSANPLCGILIDAPQDGATNATTTCSSGNGPNRANSAELYLDFGSSTTDLEGIVYTPYMQLFGQDSGSKNTTFDADLVVGNICIQSATFRVNGFSGPQSPLTRAGLVY